MDSDDTVVRARKIPPFPSRLQVIAAAKMLMALGHSGFDELRLEYDLLETDAGRGSGLAGRAMSLATYAVQHPEARTTEGIPLQSAMVERAGQIYRSGTSNNIGEKEREAFRSASLAAGSMNDVTETGEEVLFTAPNATPWSGAGAAVIADVPDATATRRDRPRKVFVVHGHDEFMREQVARHLEQLGLEAIVLHERRNGGKTLVEKLEANGDVGFAIILLSGDDRGSKTGEAVQQRARQNVILEWGYFWGRLGREHVLVLRKDDVELPSDMSGLVWELFDAHGGWKARISSELQAAGLLFEV